MGSKPKAPDNSAQIRAAEDQRVALEKQNADLKAASEATALKNTENLKGQRRRQGGRAILINTSETGLTENNNLGT
jgi:hypothetical protein